MRNTGRDVFEFWFRDIPQDKWWEKDVSFDAMLKARFGRVHHAAAQGELYEWRDTVEGRLAEIIVLDQFSRNIHRGTWKAFAYDPQALCLAQEAVRASEH